MASNFKQSLQNTVKQMIESKTMVFIVVAALVAVGIIGLVNMQKDEFPTFEIKQGLVAGIYPGATAEEVEQQLTTPLEDILFSFKEVVRSNTYSHTKDGICYIYVDLDVPTAKKDEVWSKIKLKLNSEKKLLPPGVLAVEVLDDFSAVSAMLIALESTDKGYREMEEYADELCRRLRRINKLANVRMLGEREEEIAVTLDMSRISEYGINPSALMLDYQSSTIPLPGGTFENSEISQAINISNPLSAESEIAERIVYSDPTGNVVRLKDIATIERRISDADSYVNYNGRSALILSVEMRPNNNIVAFGEEVDKVLEEYRSELPESVKISKITDQPKVVDRSVRNFLRDLLISMFVVIMVMLMLFPFKSALISSSGIPVIIAITIGVMYVTGIPLNMVTLAALITVLGMIVDDSVITMDGYMDKLGRGLKPINAACASVSELFFPMLMATLAISLMFFPMLLIISSGYLGDFIKAFPLVILTSLMISLVYAVCVVPILMTKHISIGTKEKENIFRRIQNRFFNFLQKIYESALSFCFKHSVLTIFLGVLAVGLGIFMFSRLNIQMMPMASRDCFAVELTLDANAPIDHTRQVADSLENMLMSDPRVVSVTSFIGESAPRFMASYSPKTPAPNFAQVIVGTVSDEATEEMLLEYEKRIHEVSNKANVRLKQMDYQGRNSQVEIKLKGAPREVLYPIADSLKAKMLSMGEYLQWVHCDNDYEKAAIRVTLDGDEANRLGVNKLMLTSTLAGSFSGSTVATLHENGKSVPVRLYSEEVGDDMDYSALLNQRVPAMGVSVPLRQIADISPEWRREMLVHDNGEPIVLVAADLKIGKSNNDAMREISEYVDTQLRPNIPENVEIVYGGLTAENVKVGPQIAWSFLAAVTVLFIFLLLHFRKLSLSLMTMAVSLLCLFGSSFGLWLLGLDFSITAVLGLISVVGIIIRNGIILYDYAQELRFDKGYSVSDAAYEAGCRRMRPIFLTSITTALGVLPMIISGGPLWRPMGLVIALGTVLSIVLIVLIMPVTYKLVFGND